MAIEIQIEKRLPEFSLDVQFTAEDQTLCILGPSGAGKTMLLRCIAGIERPDRGRIVLNQRVLFDSSQRVNLPARDRHVGLLFQHYSLFPHLSVEQNIAFGIEGLPLSERKRRVASLLGRVHIPQLAERYPRELSGGEQQRAALARALAIDPQALLLDEPLSALDTYLRSEMESQLQETFANFGRPSLLVTHNIEEAYRLGEQLLVLSKGRMATIGAKEKIFSNPATKDIARLTGCKNFSRVDNISQNHVEAVDWKCRLRVNQIPAKQPAHVGIRAHHLDFVEAHSENSAADNVFPCWLVRSSETPFRTTLFLCLHRPPGDSGAYDLQAEVYKEKWERFRGSPFPWHVKISPESLFLVPE